MGRTVSQAQLKALAAGRAKLKRLRQQGKGVRKKKTKKAKVGSGVRVL